MSTTLKAPARKPDGARGFGLVGWLAKVAAGDPGAGLDIERAAWLVSALLTDRLSPLEREAVLTAWRHKGLSPDELRGGLWAARGFVRPIRADPDRGLVVIAAYSQSTAQPDMTPLLACLLADSGLQVLVHARRDVATSGACAQMFSALGMRPSDSADDALYAMQRGEPAFVPLDLIAPELDVLFSMRARTGEQTGIASALARLIEPGECADSLLISSAPDALTEGAMRACIAHRSRRVLLLAEKTADNQTRSPVLGMRMQKAGDLRADALRDQPEFAPGSAGVFAAARWIQSVLAGERPVPEGLQQLMAWAQAATVRAKFAQRVD